MAKMPVGLVDLVNVRLHFKPYPVIEGNVPGLSQESFDRDWMPKATSLMCVTATTKKMSFSQHLEDDKQHTPPSDLSTNADPIDKKAQALEKKQQQVAQKETPDITKSLLPWGQLTEDFYFFITCSDVTISRAFYDQNVPKRRMDFRFSIGAVKASSVENKFEFYSLDEKGARIKLWTTLDQHVVIDKESRQPTSLPKWFLAQLKDQGSMKQPLTVRPFRRPSRTFCHPILVQWSHTDEWSHATWSAYIQWSIDALHAALRPAKDNTTTSTTSSSSTSTKQPTKLQGGGALRGITNEIVGRGLAKFQTKNFKECLDGDQVNVHVWQEEKKEEVFCCVVKGGEDVCQVKLFYFPDDDEEEFL